MWASSSTTWYMLAGRALMLVDVNALIMYIMHCGHCCGIPNHRSSSWVAAGAFRSGISFQISHGIRNAWSFFYNSVEFEKILGKHVLNNLSRLAQFDWLKISTRRRFGDGCNEILEASRIKMGNPLSITISWHLVIFPTTRSLSAVFFYLG